MHEIAVHNPCLAPVGIFGRAPMNMPNALAEKDAAAQEPIAAHSRPPSDMPHPKRMYSIATVRLRNEQNQLARNPAASCFHLANGATERRTPSVDRFACAIVTVLTAKVIAISAVMPSNA